MRALIFPSASIPCTWKTFFARSSPIAVSSLIDRSYGGSFDGHSLPPKGGGGSSTTSSLTSARATPIRPSARSAFACRYRADRRRDASDPKRGVTRLLLFVCCSPVTDLISAKQSVLSPTSGMRMARPLSCCRFGYRAAGVSSMRRDFAVWSTTIMADGFCRRNRPISRSSSFRSYRVLPSCT